VLGHGQPVGEIESLVGHPATLSAPYLRH
jgi:hypothetical protein